MSGDGVQAKVILRDFSIELRRLVSGLGSMVHEVQMILLQWDRMGSGDPVAMSLAIFGEDETHPISAISGLAAYQAPGVQNSERYFLNQDLVEIAIFRAFRTERPVAVGIHINDYERRATIRISDAAHPAHCSKNTIRASADG